MTRISLHGRRLLIGLLIVGVLSPMALVAQQRADSVRRLPSTPPQPLPPAPSPSVRVEGVVVDSTGRPVAKAIVIPRATDRPVITDAAGRFVAEGLPLGESIIDVSGEGHESLSFKFVAPTVATVQVRVTLIPDASAPARPVADAARPVDAPFRVPTANPEVSAAPQIQAADPSRFPSSARSAITGRVIDANDRPVSLAQIQAMSSPYLARSDSAGRFRMTNLPLGTYFLRVRKVGFEPLVLTVQLRTTDSADVDLRLIPSSSPRLDTVRIVGRDDGRANRLKGFNERRKSRSGTFIDETEIAQRRPFQLSDLLRGRPSITVSNNGGGRQTIYGRSMSISGGYCPMGLMIDGQFLDGTTGYFDFVEPNQIKGIEVYTSGPSVPSEFQRRQTDCGLVVVWTK